MEPSAVDAWFVPEWSKRNPGADITVLRRDVLAQVPNCPPLNFGDGKSRRGPGPTTNWLIPARLLCGAMPEPVETDHQDLSAVTQFVDLTDEDDPLCFRQQAEARAVASGKSLPRFVRHTIEEFTQGNTASVLAAVLSVMQALVEDPQAVVYLHCRAGHGRTGMVAAIFIGIVYPALDIDEVMHYIQSAHDDRLDSWDNWESPETIVQSNFARLMIAKLRKQAAGSADTAACTDAAMQQVCQLCDPALRFVATSHEHGCSRTQKPGAETATGELLPPVTVGMVGAVKPSKGPVLASDIGSIECDFTALAEPGTRGDGAVKPSPTVGPHACESDLCAPAVARVTAEREERPPSTQPAAQLHLDAAQDWNAQWTDF